MKQEETISKKFSIRDVAEKAGVSIGTVSRVLNNKENVNSEIYNRTLDVIKSLNYKPLRASVQKNRGHGDGLHKGNIGVVFVGSNKNRSVYEDYLGAVDEAAKNTGYHIILKHIQHSEIMMLVDFFEEIQDYGRAAEVFFAGAVGCGDAKQDRSGGWA